jgi:hypothetical protein
MLRRLSGQISRQKGKRMTETRCLNCTAETSNGLALCELCQRFGESCLEHLPIYFRNLSRQRRPGRPNGSLGGGSLIDKGSTPSVDTALGRAANDIDTWARALADDRGIDLPDHDTEAQTFTALCALLSERIVSIATLGWAAQFLSDIARHEERLRSLTETAVPGWYAGSCRRVTGKDMEGNSYTCGTATYVVPGLTWVKCRGCGVTTYARDHLDRVLDEAREWKAPPKRIAEALVALIDTELSVPRLHDRIRQWEQRERLIAIRRIERDYAWDDEAERIVVVEQEAGPKRYRLGDVLDLVTTETRRARVDAQAC